MRATIRARVYVNGVSVRRGEGYVIYAISIRSNIVRSQSITVRIYERVLNDIIGICARGLADIHNLSRSAREGYIYILPQDRIPHCC
jgi:hypothetical protein